MRDQVDSAGQERAHRRRLLFIPGYDPRSPAAYHRMWTEEAPRQAAVSGAVIAVGRKHADGDHALGWTVQTMMDGRAAETRVTLLRWDDLVRAWWLRGERRVIAAMPRWVGAMAGAGVYGLTRRSARALWLCLMTPPVILSALVGLMALVALAAGLAASWAAIPVAAAAPFAIVWLWRRIDSQVNCGWVSQCFSYMARIAADPPPEQAERCDLFARRLIAAVDEGWADEVVLAGFSLGGNQAVRALARALALRPDLGRGSTAVTLLTLGQGLCIQAALGDETFRGALKTVEAEHSIGWVDATSASDPASACTIHALHGVIDAPDPNRPLRRAPRFHKLLTDEHFRAIRRDPLAFHFQYLKATDLPDGYDWFALAAGPDFLIQRSPA
ncbi:MAG: hypothetical protein ACI8U3_000112 [Brevundimonas sp.]|jgi:hypothetical protein|uniref:hypothetical protein n=1 Tax=Brevundimonas sp. TaxID=1871086 RepID=UPI0039E4FEFA